MFTKKELNNLLILLNRVELKGNEAISVAIIQTKIQNLLKEEPKVEEKEVEITKEEPKEK